MPTFDDVSAEEAADLIVIPETLDENRLFVGVEGEPDHWQDGAGLVIPLPVTGSPGAQTFLDGLERTFVTEDCITDVYERRRDGLLGKEPTWSFERDLEEAEKPEEGSEQEEETDEKLEAINAAMRQWWDDAGVHQVLKNFADGLAYAERSYLRLFVPRGRLQTSTSGTPLVNAKNVQEALRYIYVEHLDPDQAVLHLDRDTRLELGVIVFEEDESDVQPEEGDALAVTEMVYAENLEDPNSPTVIRIESGENKQKVTMDLRGQLTLYEGKGCLLVDEGLRSNQRDLNTNRTMLAISNHKTGFPSLVFINVQAPTEEAIGATGATEEIAADYVDGPGRVGFFVSHTEALPDGGEKFARGSVTQFGPVDNENLRESATVARTAIYRRAKQLHAIATAGANLSGDAIIQAQGEYLLSLIGCKEVIDRAGSWLLETAFAFAEVLASSSEPTKDVRAAFDTRVNPGPLSSAMRLVIIKQVDARLLSAETAMGILGVDDIKTERDRLRRERDDLGPVESATLERQQNAIAADQAFRGQTEPAGGEE